MPIDIARFETADDLDTPSTSERLLRFLVAHDDRAYTRRELADAIDSNPETVGTNLTRLKNRDLVRHREPYWALTDDREHALEELRTKYNVSNHPGQPHADPRTGSNPDNEAATDSSGRDPDASDSSTHSHRSGTTDTDSMAPADTSDDANPVPESNDTAASPQEASNRFHQDAASAFAHRVRDRLSTVIKALYLFGSVARDEESSQSDVDVLVVIADDADYASVDDELLDIAYDVQLEYNIRIDVHTMTAGEFTARKERGEPFVKTVIQTGEAYA